MAKYFNADDVLKIVNDMMYNRIENNDDLRVISAIENVECILNRLHTVDSNRPTFRTYSYDPSYPNNAKPDQTDEQVAAMQLANEEYYSRCLKDV